MVDFADMEQLAVKALREPSVLERIRGRFRMLLVDEYQDTSPMQLSIFNSLCRILDADGRVVFVGDDKQSIYGFRGAAPELTRRGTEGWNRADLTVCHRSLPAILRFTNAFFNAVNAPLRDALLKEDEELAVQSYLEESSDRAVHDAGGEAEGQGAGGTAFFRAVLACGRELEDGKEGLRRRRGRAP